MTNLQAKKAELEMKIAKLQEELEIVETQIVAEESSVVNSASKLEELATKVNEDSEKFGVYVDEIVFNISSADDLELANRYGHSIQNSITVVGVNGNLEVNEDGSANLFSREGGFVKSYKKIGAAVKALGNIA